MSGSERLRRPDPERTEPLRQWSTLYRAPDSWDRRAAAPDAPPAEAEARGDSLNDVVAEGVAVGYRVIEEQIRQGQRVAEQISQASYGPANIPGDMREASERLVRYSADLVALWMDFVNATMVNGDLLRTLSAAWQPPGGGPAPGPPPAPAAAPPQTAIEVCSSRPVRVSLELKPGAGGRPLATHGLHALEPEKPALTAVSFDADGNGGPPVLRLRVPEGQPAGLYTGVIVDRQSGEPLGTLTARLSE